MTKDGLASSETQAHELHGSLNPCSSLSQANPRWIPMNRMPGSQLSYLANKPSSLMNIPAKGPISVKKKSLSFGHAVGDNRGPGLSESSLSENPPKEYPTPPQTRGLHPPGALTCTRWQVKKSPRPFYSNRPGARGLLLWTNIRVPKEEELMTVNIDSSV